MSRTIRKEKSAGMEYWSARPGNKHGSTPGPFTKHTTHKKERYEGRQLTKRIITFPTHEEE